MVNSIHLTIAHNFGWIKISSIEFYFFFFLVLYVNWKPCLFSRSVSIIDRLFNIKIFFFIAVVVVVVNFYNLCKIQSGRHHRHRQRSLLQAHTRRNTKKNFFV